MSETLIASMNQQIADLNRRLAEVSTEAKTRRKAQGTGKLALEAAQKELAELAKDRDKWKGQAEAAPGDKDRRIAELEGDALARQHGDAFAELQKDATVGLRGDMPTSSIMRELGYKPEGAPDLAKLKALVAEAKPRLPYLFSTAADAANAGASGQVREAGPGAQRGGSAGQTHPAGTISRAQMAEDGFVYANQAAVALAIKENRIVD